MVIKDCYKTYRHDQDKVVSPEKTLKRVRDRLDRLNLRVLSRTMRIDTGRLGIPVFLSFCGEDAARLTGTRKQMGKGATPAQSEASAVMELVERFSFFSLMRGESFVRSPYGEMEDAAVSCRTLLDSVHDEATPLDPCRRFLARCPLRWVKGHRPLGAEDLWVPIDWFFLINEYNGPAAGNTLEEAALQGLCEVVERHAGSVVSHERRVVPSIDPASVTDPVALELMERFRARDIRLFLKDFSLDTGIPTVGVLAYDPSTFPRRSEIVFTAGTATDPQKSLCRALTETAQLAGDFENRTSYRPTLPKYGSLEEAAYLMEPSPAVPVGALPCLSDDNLRVEIQRCLDALQGIGLDVLLVDATHGDLDVPVVYVIVPGAHFLERTRNTDFVQHAARTLVRGLDPPELAVQLERLREIFGPRYDTTFFLAHSLELQGRAEEALELFRLALEEDPREGEVASVHVHIASCLKELERYDQALESLEIAEEHNDELKEIYNLRGFCFFRQGRHEEAVEAFEKAIELDPGSAIDYANIGSNLREMGRKREAVKLYRMALELDPDIDFARWNLEKLEKELGESAGKAESSR